MNDGSLGFWIAVLVFGLLFVIVDAVILTMIFPPWLRAVRAGAPIPLSIIVLLRLRGQPVRMLVDAYLLLKRKDVAITLAEVEHFYVQNSNRLSTAEELVELIAAERAYGAS